MQAAAPNGPIQMHLPMFPSHVIAAVEEHMARRAEERDKRHQAYLERMDRAAERRRAAIAAIDLSALDAPLIDNGTSNELDCEVDPLSAKDDCRLDQESDDGDVTQWSDAAINQLHEGILHHTLKVLKARGNGAEKREALLWIFAPQRYEASLAISGARRWHVLPPALTPFSFEMCCAICGYRPELLTEPLEWILRKELGLGELFNEITHGTKGTDERLAQCEGDEQPAETAGENPQEDFDPRSLWGGVGEPERIRRGAGAGSAGSAGHRSGLHLRGAHAAPAADVLA